MKADSKPLVNGIRINYPLIRSHLHFLRPKSHVKEIDFKDKKITHLCMSLRVPYVFRYAREPGDGFRSPGTEVTGAVSCPK